MKKIIGAGMAGLASGITLANGGMNATIYEQHSAVGTSVGHNIMAIRNYNLPFDQMEEFNRLGLKLKDAKPIYKIIKYSPSGKHMEVFSKDKPIFYAIMRGPNEKSSFDVQLANQFESEGGKLELNQKKNLKFGDIIANRNIFSNFACVGSEFVDVEVDPETIIFFMNNKYSPQGYLYMVPWGENEISLASTNYDLNAPLKVLFNRFIAENEIITKILEGSSVLNDFACTAYSNVPSTAKINGHLVVGSAAGFLDSARGFGVKYALLSGVLAAKSILEKKDYDKLWKSAFEKELLDGFSRRLILEKMTNEDYDKLILNGKFPIQSYDKWPDSVTEIFKKFEVAKALSEWRKKYDLNRVFK